MNRNLSLFLDILRLFAALLVFVGHAGQVYGIAMPAIIAHSAKEGVAIFFVLSGFVISHVIATKELDWRAYARARAIRMYSVIPLAILVLLVCYALGTYLAPLAYAPAAHGVGRMHGMEGSAPGWFEVLRYLTFTNELWFDRAVISTGAPFWSLGYEVAYYIGFAILIFARGRTRVALGLLWCAVVGPRIIVAMPLWLLGVFIHRLVCRGWHLHPAVGWPVLAGVVLATLAWRKFLGVSAVPLFEWPPVARLIPSLMYYFGLGVLLGGVILAFASVASTYRAWPPLFEKGVRFFAGASFTIYIMHLPVMVLIGAVWPQWIVEPAGGVSASLLTVLLMLILAELGERRKAAFQQFFSYCSKSLRLEKAFAE
jgi:peptidoglycan/LPS O-acetylase OafA/YrhL